MAIALVSHVALDSPDGNSVTTGAISTLGATTIRIFVAANDQAQPTDNQGNTYTGETGNASGATNGKWWRCDNPTTSASHTFSVGAGDFPVIFVSAWSGTIATPPSIDQQNNGTGTSVTSQATGSITPTQNNELVTAGLSVQNGQAGGITIDSGFTDLDEIDTAPAAWNGKVAYKIQSTAAAVNPTFSFGNASNAVACIASVKEQPAGSSPWGTIQQVVRRNNVRCIPSGMTPPDFPSP